MSRFTGCTTAAETEAPRRRLPKARHPAQEVRPWPEAVGCRQAGAARRDRQAVRAEGDRMTRADVARQLRWLRHHPMLRSYLAAWRAWGRLLTDGRNLDRSRTTNDRAQARLTAYRG